MDSGGFCCERVARPAAGGEIGGGVFVFYYFCFLVFLVSALKPPIWSVDMKHQDNQCGGETLGQHQVGMTLGYSWVRVKMFRHPPTSFSPRKLLHPSATQGREFGPVLMGERVNASSIFEV